VEGEKKKKTEMLQWGDAESTGKHVKSKNGTTEKGGVLEEKGGGKGKAGVKKGTTEKDN